MSCFALGAFHTSAQNIMPFGDSVTSRGSDPESSYRYWLWTYLQNAGFTGVSFVGSQYGVSDGSPANSNFDQHHEGHEGWTSSDGLNNISWIAAETPDIVLFDLGANDVENAAGSADLGQTQTNLEQIIEGFRAANPNVIILLAAPTPWIPANGDPIQDRQEKKQMSKLQGVISRVARDEQRAGARIVKVNLFGGFNPRSDTKDGVHPNVQGEQKIAKKFYAALRRVL